MRADSFLTQQDCSYQGKALNVPTAFKDQWSSNNMEKLNVKKNEKKIVKKFEIFCENHPPHAI